MSWRTNPLVLGLRKLGRAAGMNRRVAALVQRGYEEDYGAGLGSCIRPGDTVWDIGANVGLYTRRFAALTGPQGLVVEERPDTALPVHQGAVAVEGGGSDHGRKLARCRPRVPRSAPSWG